MKSFIVEFEKLPVGAKIRRIKDDKIYVKIDGRIYNLIQLETWKLFNVGELFDYKKSFQSQAVHHLVTYEV